MNVLITGGLGFVGGRLAVYLNQLGHSVTIASRQVKSPPPWLPLARILEVDWSSDLDLERICWNADAVVHAAGMNAKDCASNPVQALEFNGLATARLVRAASKAKVKRFVYLSTAHVYCSPLVGDVTESSRLGNYHPYATSHVAGEGAVLGLSGKDSMMGIVLRLSNVFGAPTHKGADCWMLLVNDLCKSAIETGKLMLHTNGSQHRDFISMTHVCGYVQRVLTRTLDSESSLICNVGSGTSESVLSMTQLIQDRCSAALGFTPELHRPMTGLGGQVVRFNFGTERLHGFRANVERHEIEFEIDQLLQFCKSAFGKD